MTELTQERLKELLSYDPDSGEFIRLISLSNRSTTESVINNKNSHGYTYICVDSKKYSAHRLACLYMDGRWPKEQVDHINHIRDDNRWVNIRKVSHSENLKNQKIHSHNTSGIMGVCWDKQYNKWRVRLQDKKKTVFLGLFVDFFEACCVRKQAEIRHDFHENHGRV